MKFAAAQTRQQLPYPGSTSIQVLVFVRDAVYEARSRRQIGQRGQTRQDKSIRQHDPSEKATQVESVSTTVP